MTTKNKEEAMKKRKENQRKRKIIVAFIIVLFVGLLFTTTSYAWFTADKVVTIDMVDVRASTNAGLTISSDAIDWKSSLTNDDLFNAYQTYPGALNQIPQHSGEIEPCSTIGAVDGNGKIRMFYGSLSYDSKDDDSGDMTLKAFPTPEEKNTVEEGKFVAFDIFLKTNTEAHIYLGRDSFVKVKEGTVPKGTENAIRIGFVNEGNVSDFSNYTAAQNLNNGTETFIWEPNNDNHNIYGISNAFSAYGMSIGANTVLGSYYGVHTSIPSSANIRANSTDGRFFSLVTPNYASGTAGMTSNADLGMFHPGVTKIRVYLWLEGQDVDCEDNSSGGSLTFNLAFTLNEY